MSSWFSARLAIAITAAKSYLVEAVKNAGHDSFIKLLRETKRV